MALDRDTIEHEARHAAMAIILGIEVSGIDAVGNDTYQGQLRYFKSDDDQRIAECKVLLAADDIPSGYPPNDTVADNHDLAHLRRLMTEMRIDASRYYRMRAETDELMSTNEFKSLQRRFADALETNGRLGEADVRAIVDRWKWDSSQRD